MVRVRRVLVLYWSDWPDSKVELPPPLVANPEPDGPPRALSPPVPVRSRSSEGMKPHSDTNDAKEWQIQYERTAPRPPVNPDTATSPQPPAPGVEPVARIGLVELFAGLRAGRLAVESQRVEVPLSVAAECCAFANSSAARRGSHEELYYDVC